MNRDKQLSEDNRIVTLLSCKSLDNLMAAIINVVSGSAQHSCLVYRHDGETHCVRAPETQPLQIDSAMANELESVFFQTEGRSNLPGFSEANYSYHFPLSPKPLVNYHLVIGSDAGLDENEIDWLERHLPVIQIVVENILITEKISASESEKCVLLSISEQLATIRDERDLFSVIFKKLHPIFKFDDAVVTYLRIDGKSTLHVHTYTGNLQPDHTNNPYYQTIISKPVAIKHGPYQELVSLTNPRIISRAYLEERYPDYIGTRILQDFALVESLYMPLIYGERLLGWFEFHSREVGRFQESELGMFRNLSNQMAVAVSNILANNDIVKREKEKSFLLNLSNHLVTIRNRGDLSNVVRKHIAPFIDFHLVVVSSVKQRTSGAFSLCITREQEHAEEYEQALQEFIDKPTSFHSTDWSKSLKDDNTQQSSFIRKLKECDVDTSVQFDLSQAGRKIGDLVFFFQDRVYDDGNDALLKGIAEQLGLSLSNIVAHEEILHLHQQLEQENTYLSSELHDSFQVGNIIGSTSTLQNVFRQLSVVAPTDSTVIIYGETGTGKELIARAVHDNSKRRNKILVKVNCAAMPKELIESELFGHERGAFTGAMQQRVGKFELAKNGTLFLDEIGELSLDVQAKLLRVIQEKELERLGSNQTIKVDARIIAATNRNLEDEVRQGRFRADLFYRLHVFPIAIPPLRDRQKDIPSLAIFFGKLFSERMGKPFHGIKERAMQELLLYTWPGNIRELQNLVEQAVILSNGKPLQWARKLVNHNSSTSGSEESGIRLVRKKNDDLERDYILAIMNQANWRVRGENGAAKLLGLKPTTLEYHLRRFGITRPS